MTLQRLFPSSVVAGGYLAGFVICALLLGAAYYFEYQLFLDPCPLCIVQRIATLAVGIGCLLAFLSRNTRLPQLTSLVFTFASSLFGIWVSHRHVWLQGLPADEVPECGPSVEYMAEVLPFTELVTFMLQASGSCADVSWSFMSMSMPEWMRVVFVGFAVVSAIGLVRAIQMPKSHDA